MRLIRKKGDPTDPMIILIILIFLSVSMVVGIFVNSKISTIISTTQLNDSTASTSILQALDEVNSNGVQQGFVMMFGLICLFTLVSAFLVRVHPVFLFIYIIMLGVTIFTAVYIGNFYYDVQNTPGLADTFQGQPMINFIMNNIVMIMMGVGGISMLVVFVKLFATPIGGGGSEFT